MSSPSRGKSGDPGHRVVRDWRGEQIETLADLLRPGLKGVCVGINPSPVSVAAGHYYQGRLGKSFWARLRRAGLLDEAASGFEDDAAFAAGFGFTDIVKRPSARAHDLGEDEFEAGKVELVEKLDRFRPGLVIFIFKKTATVRFGGGSASGGLRAIGDFKCSKALGWCAGWICSFDCRRSTSARGETSDRAGSSGR